MNLQEQINRIQSMMGVDYNRITIKEQWDDVVDVVAALIDGIPGIGNLVSLGLDLMHTLSYFYRSQTTNNESEKIEYTLLGILTAGMAFVPGVGNSTNIVARQGIKGLLKHTPDEIISWATSKGIMNPRILFGKGVFKYSLLLLMVRILKDEVAEYIAKAIENLVVIMKELEQYSYMYGVTDVIKMISDIVKVLREINNSELIKIAKEVVKKSNNFTNFK